MQPIAISHSFANHPVCKALSTCSQINHTLHSFSTNPPLHPPFSWLALSHHPLKNISISPTNSSPIGSSSGDTSSPVLSKPAALSSSALNSSSWQRKDFSAVRLGKRPLTFWEKGIPTGNTNRLVLVKQQLFNEMGIREI